MKKFFSTIIGYIKNNAWIQPLLIVVLIFILIFSLQPIGSALNTVIDWFKPNKDLHTNMTSKDFDKKLADGESFYVFFGTDSCSACTSLKENAINIYLKAKKTEKIYYINLSYTEETNGTRTYTDTTVTKTKVEETYYSMLDALDTSQVYGAKLGDTLATPTLMVIKDGKIERIHIGTFKETQSTNLDDFLNGRMTWYSTT